jgi:hypothetical protein
MRFVLRRGIRVYWRTALAMAMEADDDPLFQVFFLVMASDDLMTCLLAAPRVGNSRYLQSREPPYCELIAVESRF